MFYSEQQINNQLRHAGEQEQFNHIRWQLTQSTLHKFNRHKEDGISEWISPRPQLSKQQHLLSYLHRKQPHTSKRYGYLLQALNEEETQEFSRYEQKPIYSLKKENSQTYKMSPKKVNLKLPVPRFLQRNQLSEETKEQSSLPIISKKAAVPINFLRNSELRRQKGEEKGGLMRERSEMIWGGLERDDEQVWRKGRMMGMTRRQLKGANFSSSRQQKTMLSCSQLQGCITFRK